MFLQTLVRVAKEMNQNKNIVPNSVNVNIPRLTPDIYWV